MKYSIIIPTYKRVDQLEEAIESVFAQTYQDFEIIVIDDGSPEPIVLKSADSRIRLLRHETNRGAAAARNTGIRAAVGELIAFLDSDDLWFPTKLEKQAEFMQRMNFYASITGYEYDTEEGFEVRILHKPGKSWLHELAKECRLAPGVTLVVQSTCFSSVGYYDESMPRHEDYDWLLRYIQFFDLGVLEDVLARVRRSGLAPGSLMEVSNQIIIDRYGKLFILKLGWFYGKWAVGRRLLETSVHYAAEGNRRNAVEYLLRAIVTYPFQSIGMYLRIVGGLLGFAFIPKIKRFLLEIRRYK